MRRATSLLSLVECLRFLEVVFSPSLSCLQPESRFQGRALLLVGLPVRATIPGLGVLPNPTLEAANLTVALGTGPLAMAV